MRRRYIPYSTTIADRICAELARGRTVKDICTDDGMPNAWTVHQWVRENRGGFGDRYKAFPHSRGVPLLYSRTLASYICDQLGAGRPLSDICREPGLPSAKTVSRWARADRDGFAARFRQARWEGYHAIIDQIIDIADDTLDDVMARPGPKDTARLVRNGADIVRARRLIVARRWLLSKMMPRARSKTRMSCDGWHCRGPPPPLRLAAHRPVLRHGRACPGHPRLAC